MLSAVACAVVLDARLSGPLRSYNALHTLVMQDEIRPPMGQKDTDATSMWDSGEAEEEPLPKETELPQLTAELCNFPLATTGRPGHVGTFVPVVRLIQLLMEIKGDDTEPFKPKTRHTRNRFQPKQKTTG